MGSFYGAGFYGPGKGGGGGGIPSHKGITPNLAVDLSSLDSGTYLISRYVKTSNDAEPFLVPNDTLMTITEDGVTEEKTITYEVVDNGDISFYTITYQESGDVIISKNPIPKEGSYDPVWRVT